LGNDLEDKCGGVIVSSLRNLKKNVDMKKNSTEKNSLVFVIID